MLERDRSYEGVFFTAVRTTGIFCRPTCTARKPLPSNVEFYATTTEALAAGFRPCHRCKPLQLIESAPPWIESLLQEIDATSDRRWTDADLVQLGIEPVRARRWFKQEYGMTFHTYLRSRRLGHALGQLTAGASIDDAAQDGGYESVSGFRDAFKRTFAETPKASRTMKPLVFSRISTPLGPMLAMAEDRGLVLLEFTDRPALPREIDELRERYGYLITPGKHRYLLQAEEELQQYFEGRLTAFQVPLFTPGAAFEVEVWRELRKLAFGTRTSYGVLAARLNRPSAARAIGMANGRNRLAIIIPCHRVCAASGHLTGYGGGLGRKQWLLDHEQRVMRLKAHIVERSHEEVGA